ncbi:hypothetical protein RJ640_029027 [Escallonia rubra]|uniref:Uncharacterized protein n=1 Tax=Escallonia rubra TaxID=112253 RepID=A0AA88SNR8_9ASTE|nr:hypothetical protein RJ640_029027 [Escallonia rubra]
MEMFAFGMKMDEQALKPGTDEIRGKHRSVLKRFCDMDAQPNSVGRLAHLTDDEILDRFDRMKFFLTIQNSGAFNQDVIASPVWALARIGTFMRW